MSGDYGMSPGFFTGVNQHNRAPWGVQTKEPTHVFDQDQGRSVPRSGFKCTAEKCVHCTYVTTDERGRPVRRRYSK